MTAYLGWIACAVLLAWYGLTMWSHARKQMHLESYTALLLLNEEIYEGHRRQLREWLETTTDSVNLSRRACQVIANAAATLGRDGSVFLAHRVILDAKQHPMPEMALAPAAELRTEIGRLNAVIATLRTNEQKAHGYDVLAGALQDHPDLADALYDRLGKTPSV
jgi:hypothetical protein